MTESPPPDSGNETRRPRSTSGSSGRIRRSKIRRRSPDKRSSDPVSPPPTPWKGIAILFAIIAILSTTALVICLLSGLGEP